MRAPPHGFEFFESCLTCKWRNERFFCDLGPVSLKEFDVLSFTNVYPQGAVLFAEAQPPRGVYMVCRGSVKLSFSSGDGKTLIAHIAEHGEVLGLSSALTGNPFKTTAETLQPSQVNFLRRDDFLRLLAQHHDDLCRKVIRQLSQEREADADHVRALGLSRSAAEKLANLILSWSAERGRESEEGIRVQLLMTHEDISQLIGTSRETVTRMFKQFREKKIISIRGATLTVHNRAALEALVLL